MCYRTRRTNTPTDGVIDISGITDDAERLVNALGGSQAVTQILSSPHAAPSSQVSYDAHVDHLLLYSWKDIILSYNVSKVVQ